LTPAFRTAPGAEGPTANHPEKPGMRVKLREDRPAAVVTGRFGRLLKKLENFYNLLIMYYLCFQNDSD
jgi:hypothetical protein